MSKCSDFLALLKFKEKMRVLLKKIIFDGTEISESINDTETEYASVEDPLTMHRTVTNKATYIFEIPSVLINEKNVIIAPGQRKKPASISFNFK